MGVWIGRGPGESRDSLECGHDLRRRQAPGGQGFGSGNEMLPGWALGTSGEGSVAGFISLVNSVRSVYQKQSGDFSGWSRDSAGINAQKNPAKIRLFLPHLPLPPGRGLGWLGWEAIGPTAANTASRAAVEG